MDIETLYPLVTEAIRRAEVLDDLHAPGARDAYRDVSLLEERIASLLPASDSEGAVARRGAVGAAIDARDFCRAQELAERFAAESGAGAALQDDLTGLRAEATTKATQANRLQESKYPRAYARYGMAEIQRFADQFSRQGAPLPIG